MPPLIAVVYARVVVVKNVSYVLYPINKHYHLLPLTWHMLTRSVAVHHRLKSQLALKSMNVTFIENLLNCKQLRLS